MRHERRARLDRCRRRAAYGDVAMQIWSFAEVGYQETKSSALLQEQLKAAGFTVKAGVAEIPTAFAATWGSGKPVIGIVGEFDALPGLSQAAEPERKPLDAEGPGTWLRPSSVRHGVDGGGDRGEGLAGRQQARAARCASTARRPRKAARARSTCCAPASSTMSTPWSRCIRAIATRRARRARWRTSPASSASAASRRTPRPRRIAAARRSTASKR